MGIGMSSLRGYVFFETFRSEIEYPIWLFWSQPEHGFCTALVLNLVCSVFLKEVSFSSLSIGPGIRQKLIR